jgi:hypothetical protein
VASILFDLPSKVSTAASVPSGPPFNFFEQATDDISQAIVLFPQDLNPYKRPPYGLSFHSISSVYLAKSRSVIFGRLCSVSIV